PNQPQRNAGSKKRLRAGILPRSPALDGSLPRAERPGEQMNAEHPNRLRHFMAILFLLDRVYSEMLGEARIVQFCVLASGSSGNAAFVATQETRILIDAGLSMRELAKRLAAIGEDLESIDAILITHEHSDHASGLPVLA